MKKFYVTTPIYYVNDKPHLGHVYTTVAADVLARYHRMEGTESFFLTGTDEHGQKVEQAAKGKGVDTKSHVDHHSGIFRQLWIDLGISNDDFIRTSEERHKKVVRAVMRELYDRGEIYADTYSGWYCLPDERFWMEKDLADGKCPECGRGVEHIEEKNYFFRMAKHGEWLAGYIRDNDDFIGPKTRRNEVLGFLDKGLSDLCVSRPKSRMSWGIELPFDKDYVAYVWFDALLNYVSAPGYKVDDGKFRSIWPADIHLIGKDILTTHAVYWTTMLHAMGLELPKKIFAHGWWTVEGKKMSKSLGNVIEPGKAVEAIGIDQFRYFLMKEVPFGLDGDFSVDSLITRLNADLANNFGNLASRTLAMIGKYRNGIVPAPGDDPTLDVLKRAAEGVVGRYAEHMKYPAFHKGLDEIISFCDVVNRFIMENEPWKLSKEPSQSSKLDSALYGAAESLRIMGRLLLPFMPATASELLSQLGMPDGNSGTDRWGGLKPGATTREGSQLFPRIDENKAEKIRKDLLPGATKPENGGGGGRSAGDDTITIEDFRKVELKTAVIMEAEMVPKSKKLIKVKVDVGGEVRQVVAGIGESYSPEELRGKQVIMVANLKPAKLMGIESNGMLLAANNEGKLTLICGSEDLPGGLKVS